MSGEANRARRSPINRNPKPPDASALRRRQAVALSGFSGAEHEARRGLADQHPGVRSAALGALARLSSLTAADLQSALEDSAPAVRARSAELAASHEETDLSQALRDAEPSVVEAAAWACGEHASPRREIVTLLCEITTSHPDAQCRETAVAALGSIGHNSGLSAVLAATHDRVTVRRRAVLALAAFSGPEVEKALKRAAEDRDWQVRQAAEDLR